MQRRQEVNGVHPRIPSRLLKFSASPGLRFLNKEVSLICAKIGCCSVTTVARSDPLNSASIAGKYCSLLVDYQAAEHVLHGDERSIKVRMATVNFASTDGPVPPSLVQFHVWGSPLNFNLGGLVSLTRGLQEAQCLYPNSQWWLALVADTSLHTVCSVFWPGFRLVHADAALDLLQQQ